MLYQRMDFVIDSPFGFRMFIDMDFLVNFDIDYRCLCKWLLSVKKNYRPVTYHNWRHAFNVAQTMFVMLNNQNGVLGNILGDEEKLALFVGAFVRGEKGRGGDEGSRNGEKGQGN